MNDITTKHKGVEIRYSTHFDHWMANIGGREVSDQKLSVVIEKIERDQRQSQKFEPFLAYKDAGYGVSAKNIVMLKVTSAFVGRRGIGVTVRGAEIGENGKAVRGVTQHDILDLRPVNDESSKVIGRIKQMRAEAHSLLTNADKMFKSLPKVSLDPAKHPLIKDEET